MYRHILVALDGEHGSQQALKQAIVLARLCSASLAAVSVVERLPAYAASVGEVEETRLAMEKFLAGVQASAVTVAQSAGVEMKTALRAGNAAQAITRYAEENDVDLIVIGADGRKGLGSVADKVTESAACSVLVARVDLPTLRVKDAMTSEVTVVAPGTPLSELVQLMVDRQLKATPVVEDGKIIGIITGGDLLARSGMGLRLSLQRALPAEEFSEQIRELASEGKTAKDVMASPVITIAEDERVMQAAALMTEKNVKRLPVVNKQGQLTGGIISRLDVLALVAASGPTSDLLPATTGAPARTAGDIMFRDVPTVGPEASLDEVINKILATPLRRVVVVNEDRHVLGIIVDTHLVKVGRQAKAGGLQSILSRLVRAPAESLSLQGTAGEVMSISSCRYHRLA